MYSWKPQDVQFSAKARVEGVDASFKDLAEVCGNIRGRRVSDAISFLEKAAVGKTAVLFRRRNKRLGHRKELGGKKGRYPKKAAKVVLQVLKNALNNAAQKGLTEENLFVEHACANKKFNYPRLQPKGRRIRHDYTTARVEIVLVERGAEKKAAEGIKEKENKENKESVQGKVKEVDKVKKEKE